MHYIEFYNLLLVTEIHGYMHADYTAIGEHITALHHNASATMDHGKAARLFCETWCDPACLVCDVSSGKVVMYYKL